PPSAGARPHLAGGARQGPRVDPAVGGGLPRRRAALGQPAPPFARRRLLEADRPGSGAGRRSKEGGRMSSAVVELSPSHSKASPGWLAQELAVVAVLWKRDLLRFLRQPSRIVGALGQPIIFWGVIGSGMASSFRMPGSPVGYLEYFFPGVILMVVVFASIF